MHTAHKQTEHTMCEVFLVADLQHHTLIALAGIVYDQVRGSAVPRGSVRVSQDSELCKTRSKVATRLIRKRS